MYKKIYLTNRLLLELAIYIIYQSAYQSIILINPKHLSFV